MERISLPNQPGMTLEFEAANEREFGPCPDCGQKTKRVWGYVYRDGAAIAAYFVEWTPSHQDAVFDLIIGKWSESATSDQRKAVSVAFKVLDSGPSFMVRDASARKIGSSSLLCEALDRKDVIVSSIAEQVFEICDLIYVSDPRIADLRP